MPTLSPNAVRTLRQIKQAWLQRPHGQTPQRVTGPAAGAGRRMRVKAVAADYLVCRTLDGQTEGPTDIYVAKPFTLRVTGWEGTTRQGITYSNYTADGQQRYATDGQDTETQLLTPPYVPASGSWPGDEITAIPAQTGLTDPSGQPITLIDAGNDGRQFAWEEPV